MKYKPRRILFAWKSERIWSCSPKRNSAHIACLVSWCIRAWVVVFPWEMSPPPNTHTQPHNSALTSLQEQIEREYKMRDGAAKLLQASKSTRQSMEASKGLFVSNAKIIALMRELQQRQSGGEGNSGSRYIQCVCVCVLLCSTLWARR